MSKNSIIVYNKKSYYSSVLESKLIQIRDLNEINKEFLTGYWENNIKYRSTYDKGLMDLNPRYSQDHGK